MNHVRTLREIKSRVWDGLGVYFGNTHICTAAERATHEGAISYEECCWAKNLVMSRMQAPNPGYGAEQWLRYVHGLVLTQGQMQQWRHMWLDQLIAEFQ